MGDEVVGEERDGTWTVKFIDVPWSEYVELSLPASARFLRMEIHGMYRQLRMTVLFPTGSDVPVCRAILRAPTHKIMNDKVLDYIGTVQADSAGYSGHFFEVVPRDEKVA